MTKLPVLLGVKRPDGSMVQSAPCHDCETALWEAAGRDPEIKRLYKPNYAYNVATAKRKGYAFVPAVVVEREG